MRTICVAGLLLAALALPRAASGQTAWDAPLLLPPRPVPGLGLYLTDMHGGGLGVLGAWRSSSWNYGLRLGISDGGGDEDLAVFGGIDYMGPINTASSDFPVDIDWVLGAGMGISDGVRVSLPAGLSFGLSFQGEGARFVPFVTPRVILDAFLGSDRRDDNLDLGLAMDLGLDMRIMSGNGPFAGRSIRFAASVGDRHAVGVGIVF